MTLLYARSGYESTLSEWYKQQRMQKPNWFPQSLSESHLLNWSVVW